MIDKLNKVLNNNKKYEDKTIAKVNQDFTEFIKKIATKGKETEAISAVVPEKHRLFRKNSAPANQNEFAATMKG